MESAIRCGSRRIRDSLTHPGWSRKVGALTARSDSEVPVTDSSGSMLIVSNPRSQIGIVAWVLSVGVGMESSLRVDMGAMPSGAAPAKGRTGVASRM